MGLKIAADAKPADTEVDRITAECAASATEGMPPEKLQNLTGATLAGHGFMGEAVERFKSAIAINPHYMAAHNNLGNALLETGAIEAAIGSYKTAIKTNPDFAEAYSNLGNAYQEKGALDEAVRCYRLALQNDPNSAPAHNNLANTLKQKGKPDAAIESYKAAVRLDTEYGEAHRNMGVVLSEQGAHLEAMTQFQTAIYIDPEDADARIYLAQACQKTGDTQAAIKNYKKALEIDPENPAVRHILDALLGVTSSTAPRAYVEPLFDQYAASFDQALIKGLDYQTPKRLAKIIAATHQGKPIGSILDMGCGTGLGGAELKDACQHIVGIDLSAPMLEKARQKEIYDELIHTDIVDYLATTPLEFDYFIAIDVFIYIGNLAEIFRLIKSRNARGGRLVFSTEHLDEGNFKLAPSGRYAHSKAYIEALCHEFGYELTSFTTGNLRKEQDVFLTGGFYVLEF